MRKQKKKIKKNRFRVSLPPLAGEEETATVAVDIFEAVSREKEWGYWWGGVVFGHSLASPPFSTKQKSENAEEEAAAAVVRHNWHSVR